MKQLNLNLTVTADRSSDVVCPPLVKATTFPPRQNIHKYWGKKPANVVAAYVRHFTEPGATVADPFAGSAVTLTESLIERRRAIALDVNPISGLIARVLAECVSPEDVTRTGDSILDSLSALRRDLYSARCSRCGGPAELVSTGFDGIRARRNTVDCERCGTVSNDAVSGNEQPRLEDLPAAGEFPDDDILPGWQMQKLVRHKVRRWSELFTPRNLVAVAHLRRAVMSVTDSAVRRALVLTFTAHLAQSTKMIADFSGNAGGPSWKLNTYWLPNRWQELNPFRYFSNRLRKTANGLRDMSQSLGRTVMDGIDYEILQRSAEQIRFIAKPGSIDYVFTDPPYGGEGIQYGELSALWNLWAGFPHTIASEINSNPFQAKNNKYYSARLEESFDAVFTALAPSSWMSVTFANKDSAVWDSLLIACKRAGFSLRTVIPLSQSASNITNKVTLGAPKTDLILNFIKQSSARSISDNSAPPRDFHFERVALEVTNSLAAITPTFRTSEVYDRMLIKWMTTLYLSAVTDTAKFSVYQVEAFLSSSNLFVRVRDELGLSDSLWRHSGKLA